MAHKDVFGRTVPTVNPGGVSDGPANIQTAFEDYSRSSGGLIRVASDSEANSIAATAPESTSWPLFFWNTSTGAMLMKQDPTTVLEQVGGKQHGLISKIGHTNLAPGTAWLIRHTEIMKASEGWQLDASGSYLTVPVGGLYLVQVRATVTNASTGATQPSLGNSYTEFLVDGDHSKVYRDQGIGTSSHKAMMVVEVPDGGKIATRFVHNAGNNVAVDGELTAVQMVNPRWV